MKIYIFRFNPLNAELNPICHLLALLGGTTIVVLSRLRVKLLVVSGESDLRFNGFSLVTFDLIRAEILKFKFLWNVRSWFFFLGKSVDVPKNCTALSSGSSGVPKSLIVFTPRLVWRPKRLVSSRNYLFLIMTSYMVFLSTYDAV